MKKLTIPPRDHHVPLLLLLTLFTYTFSFSHAIITGTVSGYANKLPAGFTITADGTHQMLLSMPGLRGRVGFRIDHCFTCYDQWTSLNSS
jgi:hypothetical protein